MEVPKIHLSSTEAELMQNAAIILTKNSVLQKIKTLLESVQMEQVRETEREGWSKLKSFATPAKISRGENYLGLPWLILDFPRVSSGLDLFFVRTMFWWGKCFSSTLQLSGIYKEMAEENISASYSQLQDYYVGINADPWVHHFESTNYRKISSTDEKEFRDICQRQSHLKIARQWPLDQWQAIDDQLMESWKFLLGVSGLVAQSVK